jgi:hypothetical protein
MRLRHSVSSMTTSINRGPIRNSLGIVARGFLIGVGFSIALAGSYFLVWQWTLAKTQAVVGDIAGGGEIAAKDLILSDVEEQKHDGLTAIIGSVKNTGKSPARGVQIQADLFQHEKFVDQYSTYISGKIAPGETKHFKISCGCKDSPPAEHDSYRLQVIAGY